MDTEIKDKIVLKDKLSDFYKNNKYKVYIIFLFITLAIVIAFFYKNNLEKKNKYIAENYITAGLFLESGNKEDSLKIYEKILDSGNNFYSLLALNIILEKNLISDQNKILNYFNYIEKQIKSKEQLDLIIFKKALYLLKNNNPKEANKLLKKLIHSKSKLSILAKEVMSK